MWACAHVIHLAVNTGSRLDSPFNIGVVVAAAVLILRPTSRRWLCVMLTAQIADFVAEMPFSPDHWALLAFVNLAILITMARRRSANLDALAASFPAVRVIMLVAYSASALAKYNSTFMEPVTSCAGAIASLASFGLTPRMELGPFWAISVMVAETSIPILLVLPFTRRHGVRVAMIFHFMLSASPGFAVPDFSSALFALFLLFLSIEDINHVLDRIKRVTDRSSVVRDARRLPWVTATLAVLAFGFLGYLTPAARAIVFTFCLLYLGGMMLGVLLTWRAARTTKAFGRVLWVQVPVIVLTVLWAASPYLGGRTTGVFTMFSGIRTEGTAPNPLLIPTVHLTDWQEDLVVMESTNDDAIETAGGGHIGIPLMSLRRMAMDNPDLEVTGDLHGKTVTFGPRAGQTKFAPLEWWEYKFLLFRPVVIDKTPYCSNS